MQIDLNDAKTLFLFVFALLCRDAVLAALKGLSRRVRADKDPSNDFVADIADGVGGAIEKLPLPSPLSSKK